MKSVFADDTFFNDAKHCVYTGTKNVLSVYFSSMLQVALKIELSMTCLSKSINYP